MMGQNAQPLPSPGLVHAPALAAVADEMFPGAPVSGYHLIGAWLNNTLRISELAQYEFDAAVFDRLLALLSNWTRLLPPPTPAAMPGIIIHQRVAGGGGTVVGRADASLQEWTHVPLLPNFFGEAVIFSRFATPLEAAQVASVCSGFVGTDACVAALPEGAFRQALANELFIFRLNNNVERAYPLTPVIVWFLQHGGDDTQALANYVAAWFKRPRLWTRSGRGTARADWRWFCRVVARASAMYPTLTDRDVWRMLGLFLWEPPAPREGRDPRYYVDSRAARVLTALSPKTGKRRPRGSPEYAPEQAIDEGTRNVRRTEESVLWATIMHAGNLAKAPMLLAGLHRRRPADRALPPRLCFAAQAVPQDAGMERGYSCRCPARKLVVATDADKKLADDNPEVALLIARGRECSGTCWAGGIENMPVRKHFRSSANGASAFNGSAKSRALRRTSLLPASVAPCSVWDQDDDMVIVPPILWEALLRSEYRVHGLDPDGTDSILLPLATWKNQGTGVSFRADTVPQLPVWDTQLREGRKLVETRTVLLSDLAPATSAPAPAAHYPPVHIEPLQSQRMCICQTFDHEDFDSRRSARLMAARGAEDEWAPEYRRQQLQAADAFRLRNRGALPKLGEVMRPGRDAFRRP